MKRRTRNQAIDHAWLLLTAEYNLEDAFRDAVKEEAYHHRKYPRSNERYGGLAFSIRRFVKARVLGFAVGFIRDFFVQDGKSFMELAFGLNSASAVVRLGASVAMHAIEVWMACYNRPHVDYHRFCAEGMFAGFLELEPWMHPSLRTAGSSSLDINRALKDQKPE